MKKSKKKTERMRLEMNLKKNINGIKKYLRLCARPWLMFWALICPAIILVNYDGYAIHTTILFILNLACLVFVYFGANEDRSQEIKELYKLVNSQSDIIGKLSGEGRMISPPDGSK